MLSRLYRPVFDVGKMRRCRLVDCFSQMRAVKNLCSVSYIYHERIAANFITPTRFCSTKPNTRNQTAKETSSDEPDLDSEEERSKRAEKAARSIMLSLKVMSAVSFIGLGYVFYAFGSPERDKSGHAIRDQYSDMPQPKQCILRTAGAFNMFKSWIAEPSREKLLPDPLPEPYIQPKYTLVIELNGIFVSPNWSYETGWRWKKRPAVEHFLRNVGYPFYEVVIYTHENGMTAHPIVDQIDPEQKIMYRLYRDTTKFHAGKHKKELSKLNRDLSKVICIEWDLGSVDDYPRNVLLVPKWTGNDEDTSLVDLAELLKVVLSGQPDDVRPILEYYAQFDDPAKHFRDASKELLNQQLKTTQTPPKQESMAGHYTGRLFGSRRHQT